jgi:hypothetical protein
MSSPTEKYSSKKQMMKHEKGESAKMKAKERKMEYGSSKKNADYSSKRKSC